MIHIDNQDRRPLYEQIAEKFETLILRGVLEPDSQMPSVRKLAMELSINPNTIQRAYLQLEQGGYIYPVKGRGSFVSPKLDTAMKKREKYFEELKEMVRQGKALGISLAEFLERSRTYYEEVAQ